MYTELPKITRCCFCLPLRYGLLVWAYIKMLWCLFMTFTITAKFITANIKIGFTTTELIIETLFIVMMVIETTVVIIFIVGAHKKSPRLLRIYYNYSIVTVSLLFVFFLYAIAMDVYSYFMGEFTPNHFVSIFNTMDIFILAGGVFLISFYLLALIKNEILKLEDRIQLSFVNHATDPQCVIEDQERV